MSTKYKHHATVNINYQQNLKWLTENLTLTLKPRPDDLKIPTQHIATLLGVTYCVCLATVLRHVGCWWLKFDPFQA